jgi:hypothetical protein
MHSAYLTPLFLVAALGCASPSHGQVERAPADRPGKAYASSTSVLTGDEIRAANQPHARAALERLRPWLRGSASSRGGSQPVVFVDGVRVFHLLELEAISSEVIREIRFLSGPEARFRYGARVPGTAIEVTTRRILGSTTPSAPWGAW